MGLLIFIVQDEATQKQLMDWYIKQPIRSNQEVKEMAQSVGASESQLQTFLRNAATLEAENSQGEKT